MTAATSSTPAPVGADARTVPPVPAGVRLVATDLDGTVIRTDGTLSSRTCSAIKDVQASGVQVVFVTGRPTRWMADVARVTGHTGLAICANGAVVYDLAAEAVVERFVLECQAVADVVATLRAALPGVSFAVENSSGFSREPDYPLRDGMPHIPHSTLEELVSEPAVKILVRHGDRDVDDLLAAARAAVGSAVEITHSAAGGPALLEVSAAGVSKATTLARLCEERGIEPSAVITFGDMPNDLPMFAWAGTAYAVANAHRDVLAAADHHTLSNDDDGVAVVLEKLLSRD